MCACVGVREREGGDEESEESWGGGGAGRERVTPAMGALSDWNKLTREKSIIFEVQYATDNDPRERYFEMQSEQYTRKECRCCHCRSSRMQMNKACHLA